MSAMGAPQPRAHFRPSWHPITVREARPETPAGVRLVLDVPTWPGSEAGAHLDVRLTAPDGYQATRSYSVATSEPGGPVVLAVDELVDGEVSPYLVREAHEGDTFEVHGPLGSFFVWRPGESERPVQLIGGGSGVAPLYAMAVAHAAAQDATPFRLLHSVRTPEHAYFHDELAALTGPSFTIDYAYTRQAPADSSEPAGRLTRATLAERTLPPSDDPRIFVCGSNGFVEAITGWLTEIGHPGENILTERYGGL